MEGFIAMNSYMTYALEEAPVVTLPTCRRGKRGLSLFCNGVLTPQGPVGMRRQMLMWDSFSFALISRTHFYPLMLSTRPKANDIILENIFTSTTSDMSFLKLSLYLSLTNPRERRTEKVDRIDSRQRWLWDSQLYVKHFGPVPVQVCWLKNISNWVWMSG